jgi:HlyD family secretion protein
MCKVMTILGVIIVMTSVSACHRNSSGAVLKLSGNIEVIPVEIAFRVPGKVAERPVDEGDLVEQGQLIARLDSKDLEQQVGVQRANAARLKLFSRL